MNLHRKLTDALDSGHQRREFEELVARMEELEAREPKVHMHHIQAGVDIGNGLINAAQGLKQVITYVDYIPVDLSVFDAFAVATNVASLKIS